VPQKKPHPPGSVSCVPAPELEALVLAALGDHLNGTGQEWPGSARDLIDRHVECVTLTPSEIRLRLREIVEEASHEHQADSTGKSSDCCGSSVKMIVVPWASPLPANMKGIVHVPAHNTPIKPGRREVLLIAIAKAREWMGDLAHGRVASFAAIARREGKAERHIRLLVPLAFLSPRIVSALLDGTAPTNLTVTKLARALPSSWAEQEQRVKTSHHF